ncbi:MAG: helix-turn-helix domain-containing protein [Oscillospiraceae bacterium]
MAIRLSENLRMMRVKERYSLEDIAEIIGVSRQAVAKWESGESLPDIEKCVKLATLYKVSLDALVSDLLTISSESNGEDGKYCFGVTKVNEGGIVTIPREALNLFGIEDGDTVLVLCDEKKGMALVKCDRV